MQQEIQAGTKTLRNYEIRRRVPAADVRKISQADIVFNANRTTDISLLIKNTKRDGNILFGGTFGFQQRR